MSMVVKNNMSAVSALNTLNKNSTALGKNLEHVATGMKLNSAADDNSGYAISERMRVQIRSLDQANQNTQNGSSMMKVAEGAVSSTVDLLKTLKEKVINAANDTNTDSDRQTIQKELDQSIDQINDNANITFNGKYLIDGSKNEIGKATYTSLTNQSLSTSTVASTLLKDLKDRNDQNLGILEGDKVTVSYVQQGKTLSTTFDVDSTTSLQSIFQHAEDIDVTTDTFGGQYNLSVAAANGIDLSTIGNIVPEAQAYRNGAVSEASAADTAYSGYKAVADALSSAWQTLDSAMADVSAYYTTASASTSYTLYSFGAGTEYQTWSGPSSSASTISTYTVGSANAIVEQKYKDSSSVGTNFDSWATTLLNQRNNYTNLFNLAGSNATEYGKLKTFADALYNYRAAYSAVSSYSALSASPSVAVGSTINSAVAATGVDVSGGTVGVTTSGMTLTSPSTYVTTNYATYKASANQIRDKAIAFYNSLNGPAVIDNTNVGLSKSGMLVSTLDAERGITVVAASSGVNGQISGLTISITDSDGKIKQSVNAVLDAFSETIRAENASDDNAMVIQVGTKANQAIKLGLSDMRAEALGLKGSDGTTLNISTQTKANAAINVLDNAIQKALDQQVKIGATNYRFEFTSKNLNTASENVQASESTYRDADMAREMADYTKNNVLLQASQAMLAQANQNSSDVLMLLR